MIGKVRVRNSGTAQLAAAEAEDQAQDEGSRGPVRIWMDGAFDMTPTAAPAEPAAETAE